MEATERHSPTRFLVVEHEDLTRAGLLALLGEKGLVSVLSEPFTSRALLRAASSWMPDVVILDGDLPESDTARLIGVLRSRCPDAVVIVLAASAALQHVLDVIGAGASGFLLKAAPEPNITKAIDLALAGSAYVDPEVAGRLVMELSRPLATGERPEALTPREREVLDEIARGRSNREIGNDLQVAPSTVKVHVERILRKLGAANRVEAATLGLQSGLIAGESVALRPRSDRARSS